MNKILENLKNGCEVRESLASACELLRTSGGTGVPSEAREALVVFGEQYLGSEEPKVRKNAARLLGLLPEAGVDSLVEAYRNEETRFVKSAYLQALAGRDISAHREFLSNRLDELRHTEVTEENRKHIGEEIAVLQRLVEITVERHPFRGYEADNTVLFVVNPCYRETFLKSVPVVRKKAVNGGVLIRTTKLSEVLTNRIWREAVFRVPEVLSVPTDPYDAAKVLAGETVLRYIAERLTGEGAISYRIDMRCRDENLKSTFVKRLSQETDRIAAGKLINSPGDYELTFRISETEGQTYRLGILFTGLQDRRFSYRRETVAGSLHPTDAAAVLAIAKPYLVADAQVLDPFCGVGTMLAERMKAGRIRSAFGVDTFGPAIEKARGNVRSESVWFIHRDFFDYGQDHMFDEIITNMPFVVSESENTTGTSKSSGDNLMNASAIAELYRKFFRKVPEHLRENGTMIMVSHDPKIAESSIPRNMSIVLKIPMRERGEMASYVIRFLERA